MTRVFAVMALVAAGLAPAAFADAAAGQAVFEMRCKMCHGTGMGGAPLLDKMAALEPAAVLEKTTTGTMAAMSSGLSDEDKRNIAVFVTKKPLPADGALPAVTP
jgi:cytochrome c5